VTSFAREERYLAEHDYEDDVRAAYHARSVDQLHDLHLSFGALAEALRRRAISGGEDEADE